MSLYVCECDTYCLLTWEGAAGQGKAFRSGFITYPITPFALPPPMPSLTSSFPIIPPQCQCHLSYLHISPYPISTPPPPRVTALTSPYPVTSLPQCHPSPLHIPLPPVPSFTSISHYVQCHPSPLHYSPPPPSISQFCVCMVSMYGNVQCYVWHCLQ